MADDTFTKADVDAAVKAATDKVQESIDKLEAKNSELLDEKKAAERKLRAASEIKPEDLTTAEDRAEKAEAKAAELEKSVKTLTGERDKAVKALADESTFTQSLLIQDGIKSALIANGVKDEDFIDSLSAKFAAGAKVVADGDTRKAMIGDKSVDDHIKEWAGSDAGKKFVAAAVNSGGGAGGGDKKGESGKTMETEAFNKLTPKERSAFMSDGGKLVDQTA